MDISNTTWIEYTINTDDRPEQWTFQDGGYIKANITNKLWKQIGQLVLITTKDDYAMGFLQIIDDNHIFGCFENKDGDKWNVKLERIK